MRETLKDCVITLTKIKTNEEIMFLRQIDVAKYLNVSRQLVYGHLKSGKSLNGWIINAEDLLEYTRKHKNDISK